MSNSLKHWLSWVLMMVVVGGLVLILASIEIPDMADVPSAQEATGDFVPNPYSREFRDAMEGVEHESAD